MLACALVCQVKALTTCESACTVRRWAIMLKHTPSTTQAPQALSLSPSWHGSCFELGRARGYRSGSGNYLALLDSQPSHGLALGCPKPCVRWMSLLYRMLTYIT